MKHFNLTANKTFLKGHWLFPWKSFPENVFHKKFGNWSFFVPLMTRAGNSDNFIMSAEVYSTNIKEKWLPALAKG